MDKRDKNIEDFFNKSLDQFSDAPSDRVWAGIAQNLEKEQLPFYKRWKFWTSAFIAVAALFLLAYGYYSTKKAIDLLTVKTNQLSIENQELKLALNECSMISQKIISENEKEKSIENSARTAQVDVVKKADNQEVRIGGVSNRTFFNPFLLIPAENYTFTDFSKNGNFNFTKTSNLFLSGGFRKGLNLYPLVTPETKGEKTTNLRIIEMEDHSEMPLSGEAIIAIKENGFHLLTKLENQKIGTRRVKTTFRRRLPDSFIDYVPLNITKPIPYKLDNRFGVTMGYMSTFTDENDLFGPGYNIGITNELQFFNNLYLTASLSFTQQNYEIKLNRDNQDVLQAYPGAEELTNVVTSINQHAHYLELPIGLKWYTNKNKKGSKFYVNPAVAWHFYFPQKFVYEQATNNGIIPFGYINKQHFGYFGTVQLQLGMERSLFKKMHYQVGFWAEKSLIPLGVEDRKLFNVGIRGAVLLK